MRQARSVCPEVSHRIVCKGNLLCRANNIRDCEGCITNNPVIKQARYLQLREGEKKKSYKSARNVTFENFNGKLKKFFFIITFAPNQDITRFPILYEK